MFLRAIGLLVLFSPIECDRLHIPMAFTNIPTVISCGLSIDIYSSFEPAVVVICPYVFIDERSIQLLNMNISFDDYHQIKIESDPPLMSLPQYRIKLRNNSFVPPLDLHHNSTYYLSFSSELTCRFSFAHHHTICFYYSNSSNLLDIEYHYDQIQHGSLMISEQSREHFYIIFTVISILIILICFFAMYIICTGRLPYHYTNQFDYLMESQMAKQEAAKKASEPIQDGATGAHNLGEHLHGRAAETIGPDG